MYTPFTYLICLGKTDLTSLRFYDFMKSVEFVTYAISHNAVWNVSIVEELAYSGVNQVILITES